ncbi:MAG: hypothetical protein JO244_00825 [Solirubrobacterales bacterium]|nr:hypothetical protein [Solirubrobacterales bacterium]
MATRSRGLLAHHRLLALTAALICGLGLAACGSSKSTSSHGSAADPGIRFSDCMRAHGLANFPDPGSGGGIQIPNGVNPQAPAFQAAQNACFKLLPGGGPGRGQPSEQRKQELLRLARCMRSHGFSTFPDPTATPPSPGPGLGIAFGAPGAFIAVPQTMLQSPGFQQAAQACGFPGAGHFGGGKKSFAPR